MKHITWSPRALADFEHLLEFIADQSPQNAILVRDLIVHSAKFLSDFQFGQEGPLPNTYRLYVPKTSYFLIYRFKEPNALELVAFCHASSDWLNQEIEQER